MVEEVRVFEDFIREGPYEHMVGSHLNYFDGIVAGADAGDFDGGVAVVGYFIILGARAPARVFLLVVSSGCNALSVF